MFRFKYFTVCLFSLTALAMNASRDEIDLNFGWKFFYGDRQDAISNDFDDSGWTVVNLPHDFQISRPWVMPSADEQPDKTNEMANIASRLSSRGFKEIGIGWYRKEFNAPTEWKGKRVVLDFGGIMLNGDVYLNGEHIGGSDYGYLGFEIDITDKLLFDAPNVVAVKADTGEPDNSRWYTGGGLYRDVKLKVTDNNRYFTHNSLSVKTDSIACGKAYVSLKAEVASRTVPDSMVIGIDIRTPDGISVHSSKNKYWCNPRQNIREFELDTMVISNPKLWDCDNPYLYTIEAKVYDDEGNVADETSARFGIRTIEYSPEFGLRLNGKKMLLKGIANHHTLGALGAAAFPRAMKKRLELLKEFGFNHVRTSHNPYSESFLDLCDEMGILVVDELYDKWTRQYAGGRVDWNTQWLKDVPEWVKRDRNHPSVIMWSLGNELQLIPDLPYNDWGVTPFELQKTLLRRYDDTRPVTVAMHPRGRNEHTDSLPAPLVMHTDIAAYNYRYMYFPGDGKRYPWMIFYQSEANASGMGANFFNMDLDKVVGLAYWGMIDYLGESKGWPAKGWTEGVFDISLQPKPIAYLLKSYFKPSDPLVHIGIVEGNNDRVWNDVPVGTLVLSENWNRPEDSVVNLYTFTNADEVELFINGKSIGKKRNDVSDNNKRNKILWEGVPYERGEIRAVGFIDGKKAAEHSLVTAGNPVRLEVSWDNDNWKADGYDLQHLVISAVDEEGNLNPVCSDTIELSVEGPAEIVGLVNGDLTSDELFTGNRHSLYQGKLTVILRSQRQKGDVKLTAIHPRLQDATVLLATE